MALGKAEKIELLHLTADVISCFKSSTLSEYLENFKVVYNAFEDLATREKKAEDR